MKNFASVVAVGFGSAQFFRSATRTAMVAFKTCVWLFAVLSATEFASAAPEKKVIPGHVPVIAATLKPIGRLPSTQELPLALGLPMRDRNALSNYIEQVYNPASTNFHRYLTPAQIADRFGPTAQDYQAVIEFAKTNGFKITGTYPNRLVVDVTAGVSDIERAFRVTLRTYKHPTEARAFFAPDTEPVVDARLPLLEAAGLNNYDLPLPMIHLGKAAGDSGFSGGSAPGGLYRGKDFRNAYIPGVTLDGSGQMVGLLEFDGYYAVDITNYAKACGFTNTPLLNVLLSGATGVPSTNSGNVSEVSMDIESVLAMATNLSRLVVFEAPQISSATMITVLNNMASSNQISQFSSSWSGGQSATADQIFQTMTAQGQSFFVASGDGDAYAYPVPWPNDNPYLTSVGGTTLTMDATGTTYSSETVWNSGFLGTNNVWFGNGQSGWWGSGGGGTSSYDMPSWQQSVDFATLGGSTSKRNIPDVAMVANQGWIVWFNGGSGPAFGTSMAAPLWAGFNALVNQQAALWGKPPVGFLNPALYSLGKGRSYPLVFHDITTGNNTWSGSTNQFYAVPGFDLCTGWGTPTARLINVLADFANSVWVDFTVPGPGSGTFDDPFNTLGLATNKVAQGGAIMIKTPGSTPAPMTISKPLTIATDGGSATIGQ